MNIVETLKIFGYLVLLLFAVVLFKFVSEFDYQLRKDRVEYAVVWEENFESKKGNKLKISPDSSLFSMTIPPIDTTVGYLNIIVHSNPVGHDNFLYLRDSKEVIAKERLKSSKLDTLVFRSHKRDSTQFINMMDTMYLDFEAVVRDSSLIDDQAYEIHQVQLYTLKKQKPIF